MALSRRARSTRLLVITLVFISLMTITIDYRGGQSGPLEAAGKGALTVVGPMQQAVARVAHPVGAFFSGVVHIASLQSENRQLQQEVRNLRTENTQAGEAVSENDQLRSLLLLCRHAFDIGHDVGGRRVLRACVRQPDHPHCDAGRDNEICGA